MVETLLFLILVLLMAAIAPRALLAILGIASILVAAAIWLSLAAVVY